MLTGEPLNPLARPRLSRGFFVLGPEDARGKFSLEVPSAKGVVMRWNDLPTVIEGLRLASADLEVCLALADALLAYGLVRASDTFVGVETSRGGLVVPSGHARVMDFVSSEPNETKCEPDQGSLSYEVGSADVVEGGPRSGGRSPGGPAKRGDEVPGVADGLGWADRTTCRNLPRRSVVGAIGDPPYDLRLDTLA